MSEFHRRSLPFFLASKAILLDKVKLWKVIVRFPFSEVGPAIKTLEMPIEDFGLAIAKSPPFYFFFFSF